MEKIQTVLSYQNSTNCTEVSITSRVRLQSRVIILSEEIWKITFLNLAAQLLKSKQETAKASSLIKVVFTEQNALFSTFRKHIAAAAGPIASIAGQWPS